MHLSEYMAAQGLDDETVAEKIERTRATVSRIRRRKLRPDWQTIKKLTEWSAGSITANDFQNIFDEVDQ